LGSPLQKLMKGWEKYASRELWADPQIGGFDPQNLVVEGKKKGKIMGREERIQMVSSGDQIRVDKSVRKFFRF